MSFNRIISRHCFPLRKLAVAMTAFVSILNHPDLARIPIE
jgi:hypothetical protein